MMGKLSFWVRFDMGALPFTEDCVRRNIDAEYGVRGASPETHQLIYALDLLQVERLALPSPHGMSWLRWLMTFGVRFEWSAAAIRRAWERDGPDVLGRGFAVMINPPRSAVDLLHEGLEPCPSCGDWMLRACKSCGEPTLANEHRGKPSSCGA